MIEFLQKLKDRFSVPVSFDIKIPAPLADRIFCRLEPIHNPLNRKLIVDEGYDAVAYHQGEPSKLYHAGTHILDADTVDENKLLHVLYIREHGEYHGHWQVKHKDNLNQEITLNGIYTVVVDKPNILAHTLISQSTYEKDSDIDQLIIYQINHILEKQRIPVHDITQSNHRFATFLRDSVTLVLRTKGLKLTDLKLQPQKQSQPDEEPILQPEETKTQQRLEKDFYRVRLGKQLGPFSIADLQQAIDEGVLKPTDLIWQKGMPAWEPAESFSTLIFPKS